MPVAGALVGTKLGVFFVSVMACISAVLASLSFTDILSRLRTFVVPLAFANISVSPLATPVTVIVCGEVEPVAGDTVALLVSALSNVTLLAAADGVVAALALFVPDVGTINA